ncbi:MAG: L,D-transpeptidase family protein [Alphaproteobacteria bacterium]|nr:L,D-transpeptidase family protein [Alphaproteobacteria bacterium]MBO6861451.1 L,D-transpeptidase family protein [Alphaproteobacteria bacterium]
MDRRQVLGGGAALLGAAFGSGLFQRRADASSSRPADPDRLADLLVDGSDPLIRAAVSDYLRDGVARHYALRNYAAFWFGADSPQGHADALLAGLAHADTDALDPRDYDPSRLPNWDASPEHRELAYSFSAARYGIDIQSGRADPKRAEPDLFVYPRDTQPDSVLLKLGLAKDPRAALAAMAPQSDRYRNLRAAYTAWRVKASEDPPPTVPEGPALKPGMEDARLSAIADRLIYLGIPIDGVVGSTYDPGLQAAVAAFQARYGLAADGVVGKQTLATLNRDAAEWVTTAALNMERLRWLPDNFGSRHVHVNIADFQLDYWEDGAPKLGMAVVVGRPYRRTPVFSDRIRYIDFSPTWTVPPGILVKDMIPKIKKDPTVIEKFGYRFFTGGANPKEIDPSQIDWATVEARGFPYQIQQRPGDDNALGRVKFMFPNTHNVYLHDSPAKELYARPERAFSSGCIRVSKPELLAQALLRDQPDWTAERIADAMTRDKPVRVLMKETVPVHLTYLTAWVPSGADMSDPLHAVRFRPDVYDRDGILRAALGA